jgi:diguanylate cyclase (GGDEF)-like protein
VASGASAKGTPDEEPYPVLPVRVQASVDTDPMTGLLNRRGAIRALGHRNAEGERVVGFLDCDLFRAVNETYGTAVGDEFLQAIAGRLRHSLPAHDTVARWDGDEFLVAISAEASAAMNALERVVGAINGHPIRTAAGPIEASMSVGAAVWTSGQELEDVISRAGRALSSAKSSGRGQAVLDPGAGSVPPVDDAGRPAT